MKKQAAPGIDGETWQDYAMDFERRIKDLHGRIHRGAYRAKPSKRSYIPKLDGGMRPLGIAALEDKIVQQAARTVLECIYEQDFLGFSYGYRPRRSSHQALDALFVGISKRKVNWIIDADIRGFFDNISHEWLMKFLEHRIADQADAAAVEEMASGRSIGGRRVVAHESGNTAGSGDITAVCQRVPALRGGPVDQ